MNTINLQTSTCTAVVVSSLIVLGGCENAAQKGALGGAGVGALVGQLAGRDTGSTLVGAGIGAGVGYIIGNEKDKKQAKQQTEELKRAQASTQQPASSQTTSQVRTTTTTTTYQVQDLAPLAGTRWQLLSINPSDTVPAYVSKLIEFRPDGRVVTTTTDPDGNVDVDQERYRVVGDTLIVNQPGYLINAKFRFSGQQLIISAEDFSAVLKKLG
jgi:outer membrane lipoprotein SlyB